MSESPSAPDRGPETDPRTGRKAAAERIKFQSQWVDLQLRKAVDRGDFDDLPGFGKPIESLGSEHDPDWWLKQLIEREKITGVLPPSLALRKEDAELDATLDGLGTERAVTKHLEDFNARVRTALYSQPGGPPLLTQQRDVAAEVARWRERRAEAQAGQPAAEVVDNPPDPGHQSWWRRSRGRPSDDDSR